MWLPIQICMHEEVWTQLSLYSTHMQYIYTTNTCMVSDWFQDRNISSTCKSVSPWVQSTFHSRSFIASMYPFYFVAILCIDPSIGMYVKLQGGYNYTMWYTWRCCHLCLIFDFCSDHRVFQILLGTWSIQQWLALWLPQECSTAVNNMMIH